MKIVFLNTYFAQIKGIDKFIKGQSSDTDIFCFQEAGNNVLKAFRKILNGYQSVFAEKEVNNDKFSQAIFIRKELKIASSKKLFEDDIKIGFGVYTQIVNNGHLINICNFHGIWEPGHKLDVPERLKQSQKIIKFFSKISGPKVIGGDFNLLPETKSIKIFEEAGYANLIKDFKISTTRNRLGWGMFKKEERQYFADYVFASADIKVKSFSVPNIEISDHLPQILEFEI